MNTLVIIPYLGKFKKETLLSLETLLDNSLIQVLLISDDINTSNIKHARLQVVNMSSKDISLLIFNKLKIRQNLKLPYKLCDMKPFYWKIFEDYYYVREYQYIGFCDLDVIYGNIDNFLLMTDEPQNIIGENGHFCVFDEKVSKLLWCDFIDSSRNHFINYILRQSKCFAFDEFKFLHILFDLYVNENNINWNKSISKSCVDLSYHTPRFFCNNRKEYLTYFEKDQSEVCCDFQTSKNIKVPYIHFQKRKIPVFENYCLSITLDNDISCVRKIKYKINLFYKRFVSKIKIESFFRKYVLSVLFKF